MRKTRLRFVVPAIAAAAVLAGCGNSETPSTSQNDNGTTTSTVAANEPSVHNDADITFARNMVPHHQQALEMARMASSRAGSAKVKDLASRIEKAQDPEIQQLNGWLDRWATTSTSSRPSTTGTDHGSTPTSMPGMDHGAMPGEMTDAEMRQLEHAGDAAFDRMFLEMMIRHHQGAVDMARTEVEKGENADAKALAQRIIDAQQAEITEMRGLLKAM